MAEYTQVHTACPSCGSSDARSEYVNGQMHCFSCGEHTFPDTDDNKTKMNIENKAPPTFVTGQYTALTRRNLTEATCRKWGYQVAEVDGEQAQVANYRSRDGKLVGQKIRYANKDFKVRGELVDASL